MILDDVSNLQWYRVPSLVLKAVNDLDVAALCYDPPRRVDLDGGLYVLPQVNVVRPRGERLAEAHRTFLDFHLVAEGMEYMGVAPRAGLRLCGYDAVHDGESLAGDLVMVPLREGQFMVVFPQDAHLPGVEGLGSTRVVKKVVVKIPVSVWQSGE
jgi:YhcH/YjgK/YiaL family protein